MASSRYIIVKTRRDWWIEFDGEKFGPYSSQADAMLFAVAAAHKFGMIHGIQTEVGLKNKNGRFSPKWTYGHYPYPDVSTLVA